MCKRKTTESIAQTKTAPPPPEEEKQEATRALALSSLIPRAKTIRTTNDEREESERGSERASSRDDLDPPLLRYWMASCPAKVKTTSEVRRPRLLREKKRERSGKSKWKREDKDLNDEEGKESKGEGAR